jgi:hypothetical protein
MFWRGELRDRPIEGATLIRVNEHGLVSELAVLMRSWSVVGMFRDVMLRALADSFPLRWWELRADHAPSSDPDAGVGRAPARTLAPDVRFHSPMFIYDVDSVQAAREIVAADPYSDGAFAEYRLKDWQIVTAVAELLVPSLA